MRSSPVISGKAEKQTGIAKQAKKKAETETNRAKKQSEIATSRQLAAISTLELVDRNFDRALLFSAAAVKFHEPPTLEARRSLLAALKYKPNLLTYLRNNIFDDTSAFSHETKSYGINSLDFRPDGRTLAAGIDDGVVLWDAAEHRQIDKILKDQGPVWSVAFSPDGRTLALGVEGGVVLWDLSDGRQLGEMLIADLRLENPFGSIIGGGPSRAWPSALTEACCSP